MGSEDESQFDTSSVLVLRCLTSLEGWMDHGCCNCLLVWGSFTLIFIAKNEDGVPTWKLVLTKDKIVTSRVNPMDVGKTFAVQPGRGKPAVCRAKVISCENRLQHCKRTCDGMVLSEWKQREAELEGFKSWAGLMDYFAKHKLNFMDLYRIEFVI